RGVALVASACVRLRWFCGSRFCFRFVGVPAALAGKGLVIPTEPCSRGSPPYSLQVGTHCRRSSSPDIRGGGLFAVRCQQCELSSDPWVAARPSGVPGGGSGRSGRYSGIRAQGSNEICNGLITMAVPKKGTNTLLARPCRVAVRWLAFQKGLGVSYRRALLLLLGAHASSVVAGSRVLRLDHEDDLGEI
ncbi:hypothetical protein Taro_051054, partial [Colocasia esculenta]|nr:hypothetical protein [Colocasia esculenta]